MSITIPKGSIGSAEKSRLPYIPKQWDAEAASIFREELYFRETSWAHWGKCEKWAEHGCGSLLFNCSFRSHSFWGKADMNTSHPKRVRTSVGARKKITWAAQRLSKVEFKNCTKQWMRSDTCLNKCPRDGLQLKLETVAWRRRCWRASAPFWPLVAPMAAIPGALGRVFACVGPCLGFLPLPETLDGNHWLEPWDTSVTRGISSVPGGLSMIDLFFFWWNLYL